MSRMRHIINVDKTFLENDRLDFLLHFVKGKKVLHVGFVDWPKIRPATSLHKNLAPHCEILDGIDLRPAPAEMSVVNGKNYESWDQIKDEYDYIIIPEVLEHVDNIKEFFQTLNKFNAILIITTPDAYLLHHHFLELEDGTFQEVVHPDHKCWFSPYTLQNTINSFSNKKVKSLYWNGRHSICAICEL
jgi:hypothetical protein